RAKRKVKAAAVSASRALRSRGLHPSVASAPSGRTLTLPTLSFPASPPPTGRERAKTALPISFFRLTTPSSPGGRGGGWEKRAGGMRARGCLHVIHRQPAQGADPELQARLVDTKARRMIGGEKRRIGPRRLDSKPDEQ